MSRVLVTGAAGFIGSHLCEQLLQRGHSVVGVDAFIPYYPREVKERNVGSLSRSHNFFFREVDLRCDELHPLFQDVEVVFHLAAMAGLMGSWNDFDSYVTCNVQGTQRLLEAARLNKITHFLLGSTSSVYGRLALGNEESALAPCSPYGVTKVGAEQLCRAYAENFGLPVTILRFFSVYGPRQRPDMAYHIFIRALLQDEPVTLFGDGEQSRSNTFIDDCVQGILLAYEQPDRSIGEIFNLGGGEVVTINQVLNILEEVLGAHVKIAFAPSRPGDQRSTAADIGKIVRVLGYAPTTPVAIGLQAQVEWQRKLLQLPV